MSALQARLQALRGPYVARLPSMLVDLEACWADIEAAGGGGERLAPFYGTIHQLAGTAGSFGLPEVSRHAAVIDTAIGRARRETRPLSAEDMTVIRQTLAQLATVIAAIAADRSPAR